MISANTREITTILQEMHQAMHRRLWGKTASDVQELTVQQVRALHVVQDHPALPMGELTDALKITKASVNALVNRLCRKGWLIRTQDRRDRRITRLSLSPRARKKVEAVMKEKQTIMEHALEHLSASERTHLTQLLTEISTHLHSSS